VQARIDGDLQLGADPVGGGDDQRIGKARRLQVEQGPEPAEAGIRARRVDFARGLIASTRALPASMSTPAAA